MPPPNNAEMAVTREARFHTATANFEGLVSDGLLRRPLEKTNEQWFDH